MFVVRAWTGHARAWASRDCFKARISACDSEGAGRLGAVPERPSLSCHAGELLAAEDFEEGVKPDGLKPVVRVRGERAASNGPQNGANARLEALGQEGR